MKKIILLVASILTAIQTIANRSVERTNSNPWYCRPRMEYIIMGLTLRMPRTVLIIL